MASNTSYLRGNNLIDYLMILIVSSVLTLFIFWANYTQLDIVTKGGGRVIAAGQNKNIQIPENASVNSFLFQEGDTINAGDVIATINPTEARVILNELQIRLANLNAKLIRLSGELNNSSVNEIKEKLIDIDPNLSEAEILLMISRNENISSKISVLTQEKEKLKREQNSLMAESKGQRELKDLLIMEMEEILPLVKMGALGNSEKLRLERDLSSISTKEEDLREQINQIKLSIEQSDISISGTLKEHKTNIYEERATVIGKLSELRAKLPAIEKRLRETEIRSPINGIVNRVFFNTQGAIVAEGDIIAEIVPNSGILQVEAFIDPSDIATIEPGQNVRISLTAYDATKYGYLSGKLTKVSADTVYREETRSYLYSVFVELLDNLNKSNDNHIAIVPGMIAEVDIIRGKRSILEYFWQPIAKIKDDAFRE